MRGGGRHWLLPVFTEKRTQYHRTSVTLLLQVCFVQHVQIREYIVSLSGLHIWAKKIISQNETRSDLLIMQTRITCLIIAMTFAIHDLTGSIKMHSRLKNSWHTQTLRIFPILLDVESCRQQIHRVRLRTRYRLLLLMVSSLQIFFMT